MSGPSKSPTFTLNSSPILCSHCNKKERPRRFRRGRVFYRGVACIRTQDSSVRGKPLLEDEEPRVDAALHGRNPLVEVEVALDLDAIVAEVQRAAVVVGVYEELTGHLERHHVAQLRIR